MYYIISEEWSFDSNQWSIGIGIVSILLTLLGFGIALCLYNKQRSDNAKEAFQFFQSFLPELKEAISNTITNIDTLVDGLENDKFSNPTISSSLNDKFLQKLNILDLNRFYSKKRKPKHLDYKEFIKNTLFFSDYYDYFSSEIHYIRDIYLEKEQIYSKWEQLRINMYAAVVSDNNQHKDFKDKYTFWVKHLLTKENGFCSDDKNNHFRVENRNLLMKYIKKLNNETVPFIHSSEKANDINLLINQIISAHNDIIALKKALKKVMDKALYMTFFL